MRSLFVGLALALLTSLGVAGAAGAEMMDDCDHTPTIAALGECVQHAAEHGAITNAGVARSLLAEIDAAQLAYDRGQRQVAVLALHAFIQEVQAQAGQFIDSEHAAHMISHAEAVIQALLA